MNIILGSSSPRRRIILQNFIENINIFIPEIEEKAMPGELPREFCERISKEKTEATKNSKTITYRGLIICCDTIVSIDKQIIGKPSDFQDAVKILHKLNGRTHEVISSITLLDMNKNRHMQMTKSEISRVTFKNNSNSELIDYLSKIHYQDKAGAYAIQDYSTSIIHTIEGSVTNIIGFPLRLFFKMISQMNLFEKIFT